MTTVFARRFRASLMLGMVLIGLNACAGTIRIRDLLDQPQKYEGKTVRVGGTVTKSAGVLGTGAFEIDDGTGKIYVIARGQGVPREGARTKAQGRFESLFSFLGRTMAAIVQNP
jgi:cytochrome c-type biogenesis protein CcmE